MVLDMLVGVPAATAVAIGRVANVRIYWAGQKICSKMLWKKPNELFGQFSIISHNKKTGGTILAAQLHLSSLVHHL